MTDERLREAAREYAEHASWRARYPTPGSEKHTFTRDDLQALLDRAYRDGATRWRAALDAPAEPAPRESDEARALSLLRWVTEEPASATDAELRERHPMLLARFMADYAATRREGAEAMRKRAINAIECIEPRRELPHAMERGDFEGVGLSRALETIRALEVDDEPG